MKTGQKTADGWLFVAVLSVLAVFLLASYSLAMTQPQVAAGGAHTVGLKSDGTVIAVGQNPYGQLNVDSWSDIVQVAAGVSHTVGLKSDGTVIAVGNNYSGQLNVDSWRDIVQVAAGYNRTAGLKSDGTVIAVGENPYGELNVDSWRDIVQVAAGCGYTVGLKSDGTVIAVGNNSGGELNVDSWSDIVQVAANFYHTVGLKSDGTVIAVGNNSGGQLNVDSWSDIVQVAAGGFHTVGLKSDGTVIAVGNNSGGELNVDSWSDIVQVAANFYHTVGLKSDGTVVSAPGWSALSDWDLSPAAASSLTVARPGTGSGTVTSSPSGINCGSTCTASYASGATVTLTAIPATGSTFTSWSGCDSVSGGTCTLTMAADRQVTATFIPTAISDYYDTVQKVYIGYYQRPADPGGLVWWAERLSESGGNLNSIIEAFAKSDESKALYGEVNNKTISSVVNGIYMGLLSRTASKEENDYWSGLFKEGKISSAGIMLIMLNGAQNEDLVTINNKLAAGNLFTGIIDPDLDGSSLQATYSGNGDVVAARNFLGAVTSSSATVPTESQVIDYIKTYVADPGDSIFQLTYKSIGPDGGTVGIDDPAHPLNGFKMDVPANALSQSTRITVSSTDAPIPLPDGITPTGKTINLTPNGQKFSTPITMTIPYTGDKPPIVVSYEADTQTYEVLPAVVINRAERYVIVRTNHFSSVSQVQVPNLYEADFPHNGFHVDADAFSIFNEFGGCWGFATYSKWYFDNKTPTDYHLQDKYFCNEEKEIAVVKEAFRLHNPDYMKIELDDDDYQLTQLAVNFWLSNGRPQILGLARKDSTGTLIPDTGHAVLVYEIEVIKDKDLVKLWVYDSATRAVVSQTVEFNLKAGQFNHYQSWGIEEPFNWFCYFGEETFVDSAGLSKIYDKYEASACGSQVPPSHVSMAINNGAATTSLTTVNVSLSGFDDQLVMAYYLSENPTAPLPTNAGWTYISPAKTFAATVPFTLSNTGGVRTVYAWLKDGRENVSDTVNASIILSSTPCTYTYSDWGTCQNGSQSRTVISALPQGCTGTPDSLTQPCTSPCTYSISSSGYNFTKDGGTSSVTVTASPSGCTGSWNSSESLSWVTLTGTTSGSGSGSWSVSYAATANTGAQRSGTMSIAGKTFTVSQDAAQSTTCRNVAGNWNTTTSIIQHNCTGYIFTSPAYGMVPIVQSGCSLAIPYGAGHDPTGTIDGNNVTFYESASDYTEQMDLLLSSDGKSMTGSMTLYLRNVVTTPCTAKFSTSWTKLD